jgi:hypothetical protein
MNNNARVITVSYAVVAFMAENGPNKLSNATHARKLAKTIYDLQSEIMNIVKSSSENDLVHYFSELRTLNDALIVCAAYLPMDIAKELSQAIVNATPFPADDNATRH